MSAEKRRVFAGVPADPGFIASIAAWRPGFIDADIRWLADESLHMTIVPPWDEPDIDAAATALDGIEARGAFDIEMTAALGPTPREPRLVWTLGHRTDGLDLLKADAEEALGKYVGRPLLPHVTLARLNAHQAASFPSGRLPAAVRWTMKAESIALYESLGFSKYRIVRRRRLGA